MQDPTGYIEVTVPVQVVVSIGGGVDADAAQAAAWSIVDALEALPVDPQEVGPEVQWGLSVHSGTARARLLDEGGVLVDWLD